MWYWVQKSLKSWAINWVIGWYWLMASQPQVLACMMTDLLQWWAFLKPTGTPVDQTLHVSLQGIEAIHIDWQQGVKVAKAGSVKMTLSSLIFNRKVSLPLC
jgi:hypothetical protein